VKAPLIERLRVGKIVKRPVFVMERGPLFVVVTLPNKLNAFPLRVIPEALVVLKAPLNDAELVIPATEIWAALIAIELKVWAPVT